MQGLKLYNDSKALIEYSNDTYSIYKNIDEYNPNRKSKIPLLFDDMLLTCLGIKLNPILTELSSEVKKLNIYLVFIMQSYFDVSTNIGLNSADYFVIKSCKETRPSRNCI